MSDTYDVIVIGAGPGGYVAALRAAQLGLRVACVEKEPTLGGTCLNVGCIPSKALLESSERLEQLRHDTEQHGIAVTEVRLDLARMLARKDRIVGDLVGGVATLFDKAGVDWLKGTGRVVSSDTVAVLAADGAETQYSTAATVIATGSEPTPLRGIDFDGDRVVSSTEALAFTKVPGHLLVIGAGVIGLELGSVWRRLGARVTVLEYLDRILPGVDNQVAREARKILTGQGIEFVLGARVHAAAVGDGEVTLSYDPASGEGDTQQITGDRVLVAIGRRPYTDGLGLTEIGVALDERGRVMVDEDWQTNVPGVFAIGDVIAGPMLAHKASDEGIALAELLGGGQGHMNYDAIPSIVYTHPEIAAVGKTEEQLKDAGVPYRKGRFRYSANGRAMGLGESKGFVKMLAHAETDRLLGCHIVGARAGDLIAEIAVAMEFGASAEDIARSVHAHPTLAEMLKEAALDVDGRALHK